MSESEKYVLDAARNNPSEIINASISKEQKIRVLEKLLNRAEADERYEDCQVLSEVITVINVAT
jgi:hypothetical protein